MNYDIYHIINENQLLNNDLSLNIFLLIKSIINIDNNNKIYYYYYILPNNITQNKLWNYISEKYNAKITFIKITIPDRILPKYKYIFINKILYDNGGIYVNNYTLLFQKIICTYEYFKTPYNEIIGAQQHSKIAHSIYLSAMNTHTNNRENIEDKSNTDESITNIHIENIQTENIQTENIHIENIQTENIHIENIHIENIQTENIYIINYNYDTNIIDKLYDKEIHDYSFGIYFHIINNCTFYIGNRDLYNIDKSSLFKTTIYNLLTKYILGFEYMYSSLLLSAQLNNVFNSSLLAIDKFKLINNIDVIYWINLDKSVERKTNMEHILSNFPIHNNRISAVDGTINNDIKNTYFSLDNNSKYYPNYSNTEYAILASHLNAIDKFITEDNNYEYCLIFEDDLSLDFIQYWNKPISEIINDAPHDWEILMLGYFSLNLNYQHDYSKWNNEWSALSYIVNKKNIKNSNKLKQLKIINIDKNIKKNKNNFKWKCNEYDLMVSDNYIFSKFNTYVYKYPYFTFPNNNDSTLHSDHLNYHKIYKNNNYLIWNNIIDKLFV